MQYRLASFIGHHWKNLVDLSITFFVHQRQEMHFVVSVNAFACCANLKSDRFVLQACICSDRSIKKIKNNLPVSRFEGCLFEPVGILEGKVH